VARTVRVAVAPDLRRTKPAQKFDALKMGQLPARISPSQNSEIALSRL
jgi:hypothetical protein